MKKALTILTMLFVTLLPLSASPEIDLSKKWSYRVGQLNETPDSIKDSVFTPISGIIVNKNLAELVPGNEGVLWLKNDFSLDKSKPEKPLSILLGRIIMADETWLNGELIGTEGKFPPHFFNEWNVYRNYPVPPSVLNEQRQTLLVKVYVNGEGGIYGHTMLAESTRIDSIEKNYNFFNTTFYFILGILALVFALYHLWIYLQRRKEKETLIFSIVCILAALYQTNFFISILPGLPGEYFNYLLYQRMIFSLEFLTTFAFIHYIMYFFDFKHKKRSGIILLILSFLVVMVFLVPRSYIAFLQVRNIMFFLLTAFFLYTAFLIILAVAKKKEESISMLIVGGIFFFCAMYDIYYHMVLNNVTGIFLSAIGFIIFILGNAGIIAKRFVGYQNALEESQHTMQERIEQRTSKLKKANESLIAYNNQLKEAQKKLLESAVTDPLTKLFNRQEFQRRIGMEEERFKRQYSCSVFSIVFIDMDNFKYYNDNFGHLLGDELLRIFSSILISISRKADCVARYGGDEFIILLPDTGVERAVNYCKRIMDELKSRDNMLVDIYKYLGYEIDIPKDKHLTCSFGVAEYSNKISSVDELLHYADIAMYKSKNSGRNTYTIYNINQNEQE